MLEIFHCKIMSHINKFAQINLFLGIQTKIENFPKILNLEKSSIDEISFKIHEIDDSVVDLLEDAKNQLPEEILKEIVRKMKMSKAMKSISLQIQGNLQIAVKTSL